MFLAIGFIEILRERCTSAAICITNQRARGTENSNDSRDKYEKSIIE